MQFEVIIDSGNILNKDQVRTAFETLKDGTHFVNIEKLPLKHSTAQRNYFNGIIVRYYQLLFNDIKGFFHETIVKGMIKRMFLTTEVVCEITGEVEEIVRDTRDLSVSEYDLLIQRCRLWYQNETGEILPKPKYFDSGCEK